MGAVAATGLVCSKCGPSLPAWQEGLLGLFAVGLAYGLLSGGWRAATRGSRRRDRRLRECFLGVQAAWGASQPERLFAPFVTAEMGASLAAQLEATRAKGQQIHHEAPRLERITVLGGGGRRDLECRARIESSVCNWVTDRSGALVGGSRERSYDEAIWRFVREPGRPWLATSAEFTKPVALPRVLTPG